MALVACRCPHCGGDVQIDDSLAQGFCMYCGTKILNDNFMVGHITVDKSVELKNTLALTKALLEVRKWSEAKTKIEEILTINISCPDAWYMRALIAKTEDDAVGFQKFVEKGDECSEKSYGVFDKANIESFFGCSITFIPKCPSSYPNSTFVTTIDGVTYEITQKRTIGLPKGTHKVSSFMKTSNGRSANPVDVIINVNGDATYLIDINPWGITAKTRITRND